MFSATGASPGTADRLRPLVRYGFCALLVIGYVNLFTVWSRLERHLGRELLGLLPLVGTVLVLLVLLCFLARRQREAASIRWTPVAFGIVLCLGALLVPDMRYAVKRIHVVEYLFLSLIVRHAMSLRHQGCTLLLFSLLASILFGIHDEMLQGLHPSRTFGPRDMVVNALSAAGGALIWHGGGLFRRDSACPDPPAAGWTMLLPYMLWLAIAVAALILPLTAYRLEPLPWWPTLPLSAAMVFWALYGPDMPGPARHGATVVSWLAFLLLIYPVLTHVAPWTFR